MAIGLFKKVKSLFGMEVIDDDFYDELEQTLISADVGVRTTEELIENLQEMESENKIKTPSECEEFFKDFLKAKMRPEPNAYDYENKKTVILVVGVNGVGKTTSIGKLANLYKQEGKNVILAAADTFRAGATKQLTLWADKVGVRIIASGDGADPSSVVYDAISAAKAADADILICDTAGRLHNKKNLMDELSKIYRVINREAPDANVMSLLIIDATTGQNAVIQAEAFSEAVNLDYLGITKLDGSAKGGVAISVAYTAKVPIVLAGLGEGVEDLMDFNPEAFVDSLFEEGL